MYFKKTYFKNTLKAGFIDPRIYDPSGIRSTAHFRLEFTELKTYALANQATTAGLRETTLSKIVGSPSNEGKVNVESDK